MAVEPTEQLRQSYTIETFAPDDLGLLATEYATSFWAGKWQELLKVMDLEGNVVEQFGTFDAQGNVYGNTALLLEQTGIDTLDPSWPLQLWQLAGAGSLATLQGERVDQYWTLESARAELENFVAPVEDGGYGGEMIVVKGEDQEVAGFAAYTVLPRELGLRAVDRRFPAQSLLIAGRELPIKVSQALELQGDLAPDCETIGIFLDFAISEKVRGRGLGSKLFDARLARMQEVGAELIVGRTLQTEPAQYEGNYRKRGMGPVAQYPDNPAKTVLAVRRDAIVER